MVTRTMMMLLFAHIQDGGDGSGIDGADVNDVRLPEDSVFGCVCRLYLRSTVHLFYSTSGDQSGCPSDKSYIHGVAQAEVGISHHPS